MREKIRVLVACEESQVVCIAFRNLGYQAFSCDVIECSGGHPEWHIKDDVSKHLSDGWDLLIAHPPCTYLSNVGATWLFPKGVLNKIRYEKGLEAKQFFMDLYNAPIKRIAVENPIASKIYELPKYNQIIQPYQFGHPYSKKTCLWLKDLPALIPTNVLSEYTQFVSSVMGSKNRSKTFSGIAEAMAQQWGQIIGKQEIENDFENQRSK
jgi:hypothetical protein